MTTPSPTTAPVSTVTAGPVEITQWWAPLGHEQKAQAVRVQQPQRRDVHDDRVALRDQLGQDRPQDRGGPVVGDTGEPEHRDRAAAEDLNPQRNLISVNGHAISLPNDNQLPNPAAGAATAAPALSIL